MTPVPGFLYIFYWFYADIESNAKLFFLFTKLYTFNQLAVKV